MKRMAPKKRQIADRDPIAPSQDRNKNRFINIR
jgi:hypothetical protein